MLKQSAFTQKQGISTADKSVAKGKGTCIVNVCTWNRYDGMVSVTVK